MFVVFVLTIEQTSPETTEPGALQKAADFVRAFMLGFDVDVRIFPLCFAVPNP